MLSKTTLTFTFCNCFVVEKMPCKSVRLWFFGLLLHLVLHTAFSKPWNATQYKIHKIFAIPKGLNELQEPTA